MTLYTLTAYNDMCGFAFQAPQYRMEQGVLIEMRQDAYGALKRCRLITTDLSSYLKLTL